LPAARTGPFDFSALAQKLPSGEQRGRARDRAIITKLHSAGLQLISVQRDNPACRHRIPQWCRLADFEIQRRPHLIAVGCMSHARRYFIEAQSCDGERAEWMLIHIQSLYQVERQARENELSLEQRYVLRQEYAVPVLAEMKPWLDKNLPQILPKSAMGQAIAYMLSNWERLIRYTADGRLEIDNNWIENQIRPVALGHKNYLFAGSQNGDRLFAAGNGETVPDRTVCLLPHPA